MPNKGVFIFLEGPDDERFIKAVLNKPLREKFGWVIPYMYAQKKKQNICNYINSINSMGANYIFLADLDSYPCISSKKEALLRKYIVLDESKIIVVKKEIEGWYLAGLNSDVINELGLEYTDRTDGITKQNFSSRIPARFNSTIDFKIEILKHFSLKTACEKNTSISYFTMKHLG